MRHKGTPEDQGTGSDRQRSQQRTTGLNETIKKHRRQHLARVSDTTERRVAIANPEVSRVKKMKNNGRTPLQNLRSLALEELNRRGGENSKSLCKTIKSGPANSPRKGNRNITGTKSAITQSLNPHRVLEQNRLRAGRE